MREQFLIGFFFALLCMSAANAQSCQTYPYPPAINTTADAAQVKADFDCAALLGGNPNFAAGITIAGDQVLSLGSYGINRRPSDGVVFNSSASAYQFQHWGSTIPSQDIFELQVYRGDRSSVTSNALAVNGAGNVGIGTATPGTDANMTGGLTINGTGSTQFYVQQNSITGFALNVAAGYWTLYDKYNGNWSPSITSKQGNVGIGTASPGDPLDVNGVGRFVSPGANFGSTGGVIIRDAPGDPNSNYLQFVSNLNTSQYGFIQGLKTNGGLNLGGGNIGVGTTAPVYALDVNGYVRANNITVSSDARLKKDISQITGALALVQGLRGVRYRWRPAADREVGKTLNLPLDEPQIGFVAQEVEKVVPEAVNAPKPGSDEVYSLKEAKLIPVLVEAIKEQQIEIAEQLADIKAARVQIDQQASQISQLQATLSALRQGK